LPAEFRYFLGTLAPNKLSASSQETLIARRDVPHFVRQLRNDRRVPGRRFDAQRHAVQTARSRDDAGTEQPMIYVVHLASLMVSMYARARNVGRASFQTPLGLPSAELERLPTSCAMGLNQAPHASIVLLHRELMTW
jgi:hypothetical protein